MKTQFTAVQNRAAKVIALAALSLVSLGGTNAFAQLYSDGAAAKGGALVDRDYWRAQFDSVRLDEAIKEHQPEGAILLAVISQTNLLAELVAKYPNHQDLKTWKTHAEEIKAKVENANRSDGFKPGSLWNEYNYKEAYVNYNYAKTAIAKQDWAAARDGLTYADRNLGFLVARIKNNDRVAAWPDGAAKWVQDTSADVGKLNTQVSAKLR